ncbi:MAG: GNAT family N-acetyltransferase [Rhizobiaceae bacterium]
MKPYIETDRLVARNWIEADRDLFFEINSDPVVMRHFPFRRTRQQSDSVMDFLRDVNDEQGFGFAALELRETGECLGFCGLTRVAPELKLAEGAVEIGWRLATRHWGKGYATEAAMAWLEHGFNRLSLDEIVSFAVATNHRSIQVMQRIGMRRDPSRDFLHPGVPEMRPDLRQHHFYAITRNDWLTGNRK